VATDDLFADQQQDLSALYTDASAPQDPDPSEALYNAAKAASSTATGAATPAAPAAPSTTTQPAAGSASVLARFAPLGIASLAQLRAKSDVELRQLSTDVVQYELRQQSLARFFYKNPDGSWDFTKGPDGKPTGLDASGNVIGLQPAAPATPAAPAAPAKKPLSASSASPSSRQAQKPGGKRSSTANGGVYIKQPPVKPSSQTPLGPSTLSPGTAKVQQPSSRGNPTPKTAAAGSLVRVAQ
jgi:hypothetical protein